MTKVYIDLDSMFDTRATVLSSVQPLDYKAYLTRLNDNFLFIGEDTFRWLYSKRDRLVLVASDVTPIHEVLVNVIMDIRTKHVTEGDKEEIVVQVNHYPYLLNDDDKVYLDSLLKDRFNEQVSHEFIYMSHSEIDYGSYEAFVSYDSMHIVDTMTHKLKLKDNPIPDTMVIIPALLPDGIEDNTKETYFLGLMDGLKGFIDIQFVNVTHFCSKKLIEKYNTGEMTNGKEK